MLQSCHLRSGCDEGKTGFVWTWTGRSPTLTAMEDETGKAERTQRQVIFRKGVPWSLIPLKDANSIVVTIYFKSRYRSVALVDDSKNRI